MGVKVKTSGKVLGIALVLGGLAAAKFLWWDKRPKETKQSTEIGKVVLPDAPEASLQGTAATKIPLPSEEASANGGTKIKWEVMAWNSQFPLMFANGGPNTTKGSLIDNAKLQVNIIRQDDCNKSIADIVKFASDYKSNPNTPGVFASYMGDGMPAFFSGLAKELEPLGPEYQPVAFYAMGKSYGEDKLMGPASWKTDPKNAIGKTVSCYLRDGDMNILLKWAGDNGIKVNPDETTFDRAAVNLVSASDFWMLPISTLPVIKRSAFLLKTAKK